MSREAREDGEGRIFAFVFLRVPRAFLINRFVIGSSTRPPLKSSPPHDRSFYGLNEQMFRAFSVSCLQIFAQAWPHGAIGFWFSFSALQRRQVWPASFYTQQLNDPKAVNLSPSGGDDTVALQNAMNKVQETTRQGIVLLAPGQYHLTNTIYIWPGIRLIGCGAERPVIVLPASTPGFGDASQEKVLIFFRRQASAK